MAIRDIFWACPLCRETASLRRNGRRERCGACGATFERGDGATIVARHEDRFYARSVAAWLRGLGEPEIAQPATGGVVLGPERVIVRVASEEKQFRIAGELLGWIEVFGPKIAGELVLSTDDLHFTPANAGSGGFAWPLQTITVVQPSSSSLQVAVGKTVASIAFPNSSLRLWSRAVTTTLRRCFAAQGLDIIEFQPRIRMRLSPGQDVG